jgi:CheY-like chemotaxis protein
MDVHVLLAEDNPVNQEVAREMLESLGCVVEVVADGQEAVTAAAGARYDVILMDCQMPEMDGFVATGEIRRAEATRGARVPIVALTAHAMAGDRERCLAAGMDDYLPKPFERAQLQTVLGRWVHPAAAADGVDVVRRATLEAHEVGGASAPPALEPNGDVPSFEVRALDELRALQRKGAPSILAKVIGLYFSNAPKLLLAMRTALADGNAEKLRESAHSLKSTSAALGATGLADLCKTMEAAARAGIDSDAELRLTAMEVEFSRIQPVLQAELAVSQ